MSDLARSAVAPASEPAWPGRAEPARPVEAVASAALPRSPVDDDGIGVEASAAGERLGDISGFDARIEQLAALVATTHLRRERWDLALRAERRQDPEAVLQDCLAVLDLSPEDRDARLLGAKAAGELREWPRAAQLLGDLLAGDEPAGSHDWDRIVAATLATDQDGVRASVRRLDLDPSLWEDPTAFVMVVLDGWNQVARRIGPVSAEILSIATGERPQHMGDVVVFDPRPTSSCRAGVDHPSWPCFRVLQIVQPGRRQVWTVHGAEPGFADWEDAVAVLAARGWVLRRAPVDPAGLGATPLSDVATLLGVVALPVEVTPDDAGRRLQAATRHWSSPVTWCA